MSKPGVKTVTITLPVEKVAALQAIADRKGIPMPTYCRLMLSELANRESHEPETK